MSFSDNIPKLKPFKRSVSAEDIDKTMTNMAIHCRRAAAFIVCPTEMAHKYTDHFCSSLIHINPDLIQM